MVKALFKLFCKWNYLLSFADIELFEVVKAIGKSFQACSHITMKMVRGQAVFILVLIPILLLALVTTMFSWRNQVLKMTILNVP